MEVLRVGSKEQAVLAKRGTTCASTGVLNVAVPHPLGRATVMTSDRGTRTLCERGGLPDDDDLRMPRPARDDGPSWRAFTAWDRLGRAGLTHLLLATTTAIRSSTSMKSCVPGAAPGMEMPALLRTAESDFADLTQKCRKFDDESWRICTGRRQNATPACALSLPPVRRRRTARGRQGWLTLVFLQGKFQQWLHCHCDVTCPSCPFFLLFNTRRWRAN